MAIPSTIKKNLLKYLNSIIWLQEWGIEDSLKPNPKINNVEYPPNVVIELPVEAFDFSVNNANLNDSGVGGTPILCTIKVAYKISWVFNKVRYKTLHSLPYRQIDDLLCKAGQFVLGNQTGIDPDITNINVHRNMNAIALKVRPANNVRSTNESTKDWAIVAVFIFYIDFISRISEFTEDNFDKIQPPSWDLIEDGDPILIEGDFDLQGYNVEVNRSELPAVDRDDPTTYYLEEILEIRKDE